MELGNPEWAYEKVLLYGETDIHGGDGPVPIYGIATVHFYWIGAVPAMVFLGLVMMPSTDMAADLSSVQG